MGKFLFWVIIILVLGTGLIFFAFDSLIFKVNFTENDIGPAAIFIPDDYQISLLAVGDIMLERGVEYMVNKYGQGDWRWPFLKIKDYLTKADILFGNLEGPISESGRKVGSIYSFRFDPRTIEALVFAGFDVLSLANNHILDYQKSALEDTMEILNRNKIDYVGAGFNIEEVSSVKIREVKGTRIGFLAFTDLGSSYWQADQKSSGVAWLNRSDLEEVKEQIKREKEKVDILIVSLHSGEEYSLEPTDFQVTFSRVVIEAGADMVIGHHPHVVQKIERYRDKWIAYSLGNFIFDQGFSQETMEGLLLEIKISGKKIKEVIGYKIKMNQFFQPYIIDENI